MAILPAFISVIMVAIVHGQTCNKGEQSGSAITSNLVKTVLGAADVNVRPDADYGGPTVIQQNILPFVFEGPSIGTDYYRLHFAAVNVWNDVRLAWNPDQYAGKKTVLLPVSGIWIPDLLIYNPYSPSPDVQGEHPFPVSVASNGQVSQRTIGSVDIFCVTASNKSVICSFLLGSWTSDATMISIQPYVPFDVFSMYQTSYDFVPVSSWTQPLIVNPVCCSTAGYSVLNYTFVFQPVNLVNTGTVGNYAQPRSLHKVKSKPHA